MWGHVDLTINSFISDFINTKNQIYSLGPTPSDYPLREGILNICTFLISTQLTCNYPVDEYIKVLPFICSEFVMIGWPVLGHFWQDENQRNPCFTWTPFFGELTSKIYLVLSNYSYYKKHTIVKLKKPWMILVELKKKMI